MCVGLSFCHASSARPCLPVSVQEPGSPSTVEPLPTSCWEAAMTQSKMGVMNCMLVSAQDSCIETLTASGMVLGGRVFGRDMG